MASLGIKGKTLLPILLVGGIVCAGVVWKVTQVSSEAINRAALEKAKGLATQMSALRSYYTKHVVTAAKQSGVKVSYDYAEKRGTIPLPATMVHELSASLSQKEGYTIRLFSQYPFPFRKDGGAHDKFEREALQALTAKPDKPYWRQEDLHGVSTIRFAVADKMISPTCVNCHNSHPLSPKRDWKLGDVRGAMEVNVPIGQAQAAAAMGTLQLILMIGGGLIAIMLIAAYSINRVLGPLGKMTLAANGLAQGDVEQQISVESRDEIGRIADSFRSVIAYQKTIVGMADAIAEGNLTQNVTPKSERDAVGKAFAHMIASLRRLIGEVAQSANQVALTSAQLSASAQQTDRALKGIGESIQEVAGASNQSARTSQEIAQASERQAGYVSEAADAIHQLEGMVGSVQQSVERQQNAVQQVDIGMTETARLVENVAHSAQQMASTARQSSDIARMGGEAVEQTVASMERIRLQVKNSTVTVETLGRKGQEIGAIVETIDQIAEQTNLLALNAAIEAARAGEHGKGFAIVADEVRKLAERSAAATREIAALIGGIKGEVAESIRAMEISNQEVAEGAARSAEAGSALTQILGAVQAVASEVEGISSTSEQMTTSMQQVLVSLQRVYSEVTDNGQAVREMSSSTGTITTVISGVAAVSQEAAAGAEEMSAAAEEVSANTQQVSRTLQEQRAGVEQVSQMAGELKFMATRLQELLSQFDLDTNVPEVPSLSTHPVEIKRLAA